MDEVSSAPANVIAALLESLDEFAPGRVLQHHGRRIAIFRDVIQSKMHVHGARAENALRARDLAAKKLLADGRRIAELRSHRTADTGQQNLVIQGTS
jgi:hypothetical protein